MGYDFNIEYKKTTEFGQADALSRLMTKQDAQPEDMVIAKVELEVNDVFGETVKQLPVSANEIAQETRGDWVCLAS